MHEVSLPFFSCSVLFHFSLSYCNLISAKHLCIRYHYLGALTMKSLQFKAINKVSLATFKNWSVSSLLTSVFTNQLPFKDPIWHFQLITIMPLWWALWESSVTTLFIKFFSFTLVKNKRSSGSLFYSCKDWGEKKYYFLQTMIVLFFLVLLFPFRKKRVSPHLQLVIRYYICFESVNWHTRCF